MSHETVMETVNGFSVAELTKDKEESDSESEDGDVSPFVLTPISFRSLVGHDDEVNACCFSPDWTRLVSGGDDWVVKVWDTHSGQPVYTLTSHKGEGRDGRVD
jgi:WD40 repeat protein